MLDPQGGLLHAQGTDGKSARDLATSEGVKELLEEPAKAFSF